MKKHHTYIVPVLALAMAACTGGQKQPRLYQHNLVDNADKALALLNEGNARFVQNTPLPDDISQQKLNNLKQNGQQPFAIILTCSDSRVSPELIFDQGIGDLFVIRVAGNVVDSVGMGSIQYAAEHLNVPLIMVLGHEKCGAVNAAVQGGELPGCIPAIAQRIKPSVNEVKNHQHTPLNINELVVDANIRTNVNTITNDPVISHLMHLGKVKVLGAKYLLGSGKVELFQNNQHNH
jgi:carbonic anhydrase